MKKTGRDNTMVPAWSGMMQRISAIMITFLLILGTAVPVLAAGGSDSGNSGGDMSPGDGGAPSDRGSSLGNAGTSTGSDSDSPGSQSGDRIQTGQGSTGVPSGVLIEEQSGDRSPASAGPSDVPTLGQSRSQSLNQTELSYLYLMGVHDRWIQLLPEHQVSPELINRDLALFSITAAGNVTGRNATQFIELAEQVNQSYSVTDQARIRILEQSRIARLFLGGDAPAARVLLQATEENQDRIRLMEQDLENCDCNQTIRELLQEQLMVLSEDQGQLRILANQTLQDRGIFGGLLR